MLRQQSPVCNSLWNNWLSVQTWELQMYYRSTLRTGPCMWLQAWFHLLSREVCALGSAPAGWWGEHASSAMVMRHTGWHQITISGLGLWLVCHETWNQPFYGYSFLPHSSLTWLETSLYSNHLRGPSRGFTVYKQPQTWPSLHTLWTQMCTHHTHYTCVRGTLTGRRTWGQYLFYD